MEAILGEKTYMSGKTARGNSASFERRRRKR